MTRRRILTCRDLRNDSAKAMMRRSFPLGIALLARSIESKADVWHPDATITKLAFGSCHKRKYVDPEQGVVWDAIVAAKPDTFLWTGDAAYPPSGGISSLELLRHEYYEMLTNKTLGYLNLNPVYGKYGTWDDHDFGGNDLGIEMPDKIERKKAFFEFLNFQPSTERMGVYNTIEWGTAPTKVKAILLDTRWHREQHCIPSMATTIPLGAAFACITRWITAGLNFQDKISSCRNPSLLGETQWEWLEQELLNSDAQVHVVVSSIQVLTTNPVMESWGHFPEERERLMRLLNGVPGLVLLSGDVHHAEILDPTANIDTNKKTFLEVTSSGLTHSCTQPFYGGLCQPLLESFSAHRYQSSVDRNQSPFYFLQRNFGTLDINWDPTPTLTINVHNHMGDAVFTVGPKSLDVDMLTDFELSQVAPCVDGHLLPFFKRILTFGMLALGALLKKFLNRQHSTGSQKHKRA